MMEKKKKGMDIVTKMSIVGGLGLVCILILVGIIAFALKGKTPNKEADNNGDIRETQSNNQEDEEFIRSIALIKNVNTQSNKLTIFEIENDKEVVLNIDGAVDIKDEFGTLLAFAQLKMGDIIEIKYDNTSLRPETIRITNQIWERKNIQNLMYDKNNKSIQIGNDVYSFTDDLIVIYAGNKIDLDDLDSVDLVNIKGYKDKIWYIELEKTHGYITLKNHDKFIGGTIEIGKITKDVLDETKITVLIGVQNVIISKPGMTSFITQVIVEEGKEVIIDVGAALPTVGLVSFTINPKDAKLYINNKEYRDFSKPITLDFGSYDIKIVKDNYVTSERKLVVNEAFMTVEISMDKTARFMNVDKPEGVELYIDSNYIGIIPINTPINAGSHTITLRKEGFYSKMHSILIEDNGQDAYFSFPDLIAMPTELENE